jgi:phosphoribosyl-ATP pyrophosphohydrolase
LKDPQASTNERQRHPGTPRDVIEQRKAGDPTRVTWRAFHKGTDAILKKIGEEATETVMAAKDGDAHKLVP